MSLILIVSTWQRKTTRGQQTSISSYLLRTNQKTKINWVVFSLDYTIIPLLTHSTWPSNLKMNLQPLSIPLVTLQVTPKCFCRMGSFLNMHLCPTNQRNSYIKIPLYPRFIFTSLWTTLQFSINWKWKSSLSKIPTTKQRQFKFNLKDLISRKKHQVPQWSWPFLPIPFSK